MLGTIDVLQFHAISESRNPPPLSGRKLSFNVWTTYYEAVRNFQVFHRRKAQWAIGPRSLIVLRGFFDSAHEWKAAPCPR